MSKIYIGKDPCTTKNIEVSQNKIYNTVVFIFRPSLVYHCADIGININVKQLTISSNGVIELTDGIVETSITANNSEDLYISIYNDCIEVLNTTKNDNLMVYRCVYDEYDEKHNKEISKIKNKKHTKVIRLRMPQDILNKKIDIIENHGGKIKNIKTKFNNDHKAVGIFYIDAIITYQAKEPNFSEINKLLDIK